MMADDNTAPTIVLDCPTVSEPAAKPAADDRLLSILGVAITDVTRHRAVELLEDMILQRDGHTRRVFFVNAHTLNMADADEAYRRVVCEADYVFGDGTGVRWASRLQGASVRDNLVGTDLIPTLFRETADRGYRYFLLGADRPTIQRAAAYAQETFPGWVQAGYRDGYLASGEENAQAIRQINQTKPHVLLVGMGNPLQESWIQTHRHELEVPVAMGVGGLFGYWAGDIRRAPAWLRRCGAEWLGILLQQPHKARRYLLGNPLFLARVLRDAWTNRRRGNGRGNVA